MTRAASTHLRRAWLAAVTAMAIVALFALLGCGDCARGSVPGPTPGPLHDLASTLTWAGGIVGGLALVLRLVAALGLVAGPLGGLLGLAAPLLSLAGWAGGATLVAGLALRWVADHPIVVVAAVVAAGLARWAWRHPAVGRRLVAWARDRATRPHSTHKTP